MDGVYLDIDEAYEIAEDLVPEVVFASVLSVESRGVGTTLDLINTARVDPDLNPMTLEDFQGPDGEGGCL